MKYAGEGVHKYILEGISADVIWLLRGRYEKRNEKVKEKIKEKFNTRG